VDVVVGASVVDVEVLVVVVGASVVDVEVLVLVDVEVLVVDVEVLVVDVVVKEEHKPVYTIAPLTKSI
jgi:hypothetical protein